MVDVANKLPGHLAAINALRTKLLDLETWGDELEAEDYNCQCAEKTATEALERASERRAQIKEQLALFRQRRLDIQVSIDVLQPLVDGSTEKAVTDRSRR